MRFSASTAASVTLAFLAGLLAPVLYQRWNQPAPETPNAAEEAQNSKPQASGPESQSHRVSFLPLAAPVENAADLPVLAVRDVERIRARAGAQARIRGRIFRVGHSAKSNTYFLNFGPSREALTAVIFASAVALFEKNKVSPKSFEGKEVEVSGEIKDHPQYGLEVIVENPSQIKVVN